MHGFTDTPQLETPSPATLLAQAHALTPAITARIPQADVQRDLPPETIAEFQQAGLLRAFQPRAWGGFEADPRTVLDLQNVFAQACPSTGWVYGVLCVQAFILARFPAQAQAEVWGPDPDTLVSSSFQPAGKVTPAEGGFRLTGRWTFSSGSTHCQWAIVGGLDFTAPGEPPHWRLFLIPRADYTIIDTWQTPGMRGTGSNDLEVTDIFIPTHRTYRPDAGLLPLADSTLPPLYRLPWLYIFTSMIANPAIGMARGAMAAFAEIARTRKPGPGTPAGPSPRDIQAFARAQAEIDAFDALEKRNFGRLLEAATAGEEVKLSEALLYRSQLTAMVRRIFELIDELMLLAGSRGFRGDSPIGRFWLDLSIARTHVGNDPLANFTQLSTEIFAGR